MLLCAIASAARGDGAQIMGEARGTRCCGAAAETAVACTASACSTAAALAAMWASAVDPGQGPASASWRGLRRFSSSARAIAMAAAIGAASEETSDVRTRLSTGDGSPASRLASSGRLLTCGAGQRGWGGIPESAAQRTPGPGRLINIALGLALQPSLATGHSEHTTQESCMWL